MFTPETVSTDYEPTFSRERASGIDSDSLSTLDRVYHGERDAGHPAIVVIDEDGSEGPLTPALGRFDWGWPSMNATRQLARALLIDVTGREPPPAVRDAFATEELAHFPWGSFSMTGRELLEWIDSRGYELAGWPPATSTPVISAPAVPASPRRDRRAFVPLFLRLARTRAPLRALGASR